jgi:hypothetical protein
VITSGRLALILCDGNVQRSPASKLYGFPLEGAVLKRFRADLKLLRVSPGGAAAWQTIREYEGDGERTTYTPRALTENGEGALLVTWFERDPGLSHALATRTRVLPWELDVVISAVDGMGNGYGVISDRVIDGSQGT